MFRIRRRFRVVIGRSSRVSMARPCCCGNEAVPAPGVVRLVMGKARWDVDELLALGELMEQEPADLMRVAEGLLKVRDREGVERPLQANAVQRMFEREYGR